MSPNPRMQVREKMDPKALKHLIADTKKYWPLIVVSVILCLISCVLQVLAPTVLGEISQALADAAFAPATLDLDYIHDSTAEVDLNVIMTDKGRFVELQGCAEHKAFSDQDLAAMIDLAKKGLKKLFALQKKALKK